MGPLLAALVVIPFGQASIGWFALAAILAILILTRIGNWYKLRLTVTANRPAAAAAAPAPPPGKTQNPPPPWASWACWYSRNTFTSPA